MSAWLLAIGAGIALALLGYAGRVASASPAVGYLAKHQEQQRNLLEQALAPKFKSFMLTK